MKVTKSGSRMNVGLGVIIALKAHRARQLEERMGTPDWKDSGLVFPNPKR